MRGPAVPGDTLVTNIDWRLQRIVERAMASGIVRVGRHLSGAVVAENPWNGEILALASYPNYDPNDFTSDRWKRVAYDLEDASQPLFDRAIAAATPTGSTFKMVTGSAALTEGVVKVEPGYRRYRRLELRRLLRARYRRGRFGRYDVRSGAGRVE